MKTSLLFLTLQNRLAGLCIGLAIGEPKTPEFNGFDFDSRADGNQTSSTNQ